jgi:hypothetical protein
MRRSFEFFSGGTDRLYHGLPIRLRGFTSLLGLYPFCFRRLTQFLSLLADIIARLPLVFGPFAAPLRTFTLQFRVDTPRLAFGRLFSFWHRGSRPNVGLCIQLVSPISDFHRIMRRNATQGTGF